MTPTESPTAEALKLARDALAALEAMAERYRPPGYPMPDAQKQARAALAAIDALPASVPSGEPAAKKPHGCEHRNGQFCGKAGPCLYPKCAPTVPAAPAPAAVPASEPNESLVIGQAQQLIGALIAHRLLHKSMPEPDYINLWDVVKRHLRLVNKEGARTMSAAPAPAPPPDAQALQQARWEGIQSVQVQTAEIVRAALELLDSVGEGLPPDALAAFKRVFGGAAPAVAAPEPRTLTDAQIERHGMPASECPPDSVVMLVSSIRRLLGMAAAPTTQEPQQ